MYITLTLWSRPVRRSTGSSPRHRSAGEGLSCHAFRKKSLRNWKKHDRHWRHGTCEVLRPEKKILDGLTFQIDTGERVGILGRNGGKTTLLKILTGELDYDEGEVFIAPGKRLGLISQIPRLPGGIHCGGCAAHGLFPDGAAERGDGRLGGKMAAGDSSAATLKALRRPLCPVRGIGRLGHRYRRQQGGKWPHHR